MRNIYAFYAGFVMIGFFVILGLILNPFNASAADHTCQEDSDAQYTWKCDVNKYDAIQMEASNIEYRKDSLKSYWTVSESESTGWISLDDTNLKDMEEYSENDASGGTDITPGGYTTNDDGGGCYSIIYTWTGLKNGDTFTWKNEVFACDVVTDHLDYYDMFYFASDPGEQNYLIVNHRSQPTVVDTTNDMYKYNLRQGSAWDETRNEMTVGAYSADGSGYSVKVAGGASDANILYYDPDPNDASHFIWNLNRYSGGYSDSTPFFGNNNEDSQNVRSDVWWTWCRRQTGTAVYTYGAKLIPSSWPD